jgi:hypothetical protein
MQLPVCKQNRYSHEIGRPTKRLPICWLRTVFAEKTVSLPKYSVGSSWQCRYWWVNSCLVNRKLENGIETGRRTDQTSTEYFMPIAWRCFKQIATYTAHGQDDKHRESLSTGTNSGTILGPCDCIKLLPGIWTIYHNRKIYEGNRIQL